MKLRPLTRVAELRQPDGESREIELTFSSEAPVDRWFGTEVLVHEPKAARLGRLNDGAPLLFNHDLDDVIGVVERGWIGKDKRGHAVVRLARTARGDEVLAMIADRVLRNVSFMYRVHEWEQTSRDEGDSFRVTDWEALEISVVSVPADQSVGIGRGSRTFATAEQEVRLCQAPGDSPGPAQETPMSAASETVAKPDNKPKAEPTERVELVREGYDAKLAEQQEDARVTAIRKLGKANRIGEDTVVGWIQRGASLNDVADDIIRIYEKRSKEKPDAVSALDLTEHEAHRYSLSRAILAASSADWSEAGFELECHKEIAKRTDKIPKKHGFFVPMEVQRRQRERDLARVASRFGIPHLMQRDLTVAGVGELVATSIMGFDELLRNLSVILRMGATRLSGLRDTITVPRQTAAATAVWLANEASTITESTQTFTQLTLAPKNVGAYTEISRQLLLQSTPDVEGLVETDLAAVVALAVDAAGLSGSGASGQPQGLDNVSGVGAVTGTSLDFADVLEFQTDVAAGNVMPMRGGYVTTPAVASLMIQRVKYTSTASPLWEGSIWSGTMQGFPALSSNQVAAATMYFGDWAKMVLAEWGVLEIDTNPYANFQAAIIGVRAIYSIDIGVRYPVAFSIATSIT